MGQRGDAVILRRTWSVTRCRDAAAPDGWVYSVCLTADPVGEIVESNLTHGQAKNLARKLRERDINRPVWIGERHD